MKNLSIIVAVANQGVIGVNNTLPWYLPEDLKRFRALTNGHHIIMGRKTYESLGRLLPDRTTVIVTRNSQYRVEGAHVVHSIEDALKLCENDTEPFLIGGAELYRHALKLANKLYMTKVALDVEGDAFFPAFDMNNWRLVTEESHLSVKNIVYSDLVYEK